MAGEEIVAAEASPVPVDQKRKLEDIEPADPERDDVPENAEAQPVEDDGEAALEPSEPKRPRLEDNSTNGIADENGFKPEKLDETQEEEEGKEAAEEKDDEDQVANGEPPSTKSPDAAKSESVEGTSFGTEQLLSGADEDVNGEQVDAQKSEGDNNEKSEDDNNKTPAQEENNHTAYEDAQQEVDDAVTITRKMEVPNAKVGVLIGKAGDTIRYLQYNSGAKIQIMRDAEADRDAPTRPVEIIGTLSSISKAEKLIQAVIAEADAGGSPSLIARGITSSQSVGAVEQIEIQVPNEKVGLIIGRGGETIKGLQTKTGARIQLIPQHLPEGDGSKERVVRVTGDKRQIDLAKEMIKDAMSQTVRPSSFSGGFNQQGYRPRGPSGPPQWGPRGHNQQMPYDYHHQGPYPSQSSHYQHSNYGGYHSQQMPPRSVYGSGWEQRPPHSVHGPQSGGYDYYGRPGPHSTSGHDTGPSPAPAMGPPASQSNYYGHPRGPDYMHPPPYSQGGPQHGYGHGYEEQKYDNHAPVQNPYGAHGAAQQGYAQPGYGQQQYGKPTPYGMTSQGPPVQTYGPPATSHPGEVPNYQGPTAAAQSYGTHAPTPQQYPYASGAPMQQSYPPYASAPTDGYGQQPSASVPTYTQQGSQQVPNYSQPSSQQAPGYAQAAPAGAYASYPSQGYTEQPASNNATYGYQGAPDPSYSGAPQVAYTAPAGQPTYPPAATAQPGYDQSYTQSGGYAATQGAAPGTYG